MKLAELIKSNHWLSVEATLIKLYPHLEEDMENFEKVYDQLKLTLPIATDIRIKLNRVKDPLDKRTYIVVSGYEINRSTKQPESDELLELEFVPWNKWLGMAIDEDTMQNFNPLEIVSHCLCEMTIVGFDQKEIQSELEELNDIHEEFKLMSPEEKERFENAVEKLALIDDEFEFDEEASEFDSVNRDALIMFPKQALYDWINSVFPEEPVECPRVLEHDSGNVYLLDERDHHSEALSYLEQNFATYFEYELLDWCMDEKLWPKNRTWELFNTWFHISIQTIVLDAGSGRIEKEIF